MRRARPDLIVPIRDRRQHRRILTLKNFRNAIFVVLALFAGITIEANLRDRKPHEDYGRLMSPRISSAEALPKQPQITPSETIDDQNAADPTLVQPAIRSQILRDDPPPAPPQTATAPTSPTPVVPGNSAPTIVGGPDGVTIVQSQMRQPVLHGGFGH